jgi:hypothetical protein
MSKAVIGSPLTITTTFCARAAPVVTATKRSAAPTSLLLL